MNKGDMLYDLQPFMDEIELFVNIGGKIYALDGGSWEWPDRTKEARFMFEVADPELRGARDALGKNASTTGEQK